MSNLSERLARLRAQNHPSLKLEIKPTTIVGEAASTVSPAPTESIPAESSNDSHGVDQYGNSITYNANQLAFADLAVSGVDCILIGAAGTGKTTTQKLVINRLIQSNKAGILQAEGHKHLRSNTPGIVVCAYTRRATNNIAKNLSADLRDNCITIHKLLEYSPVYYDVQDEITGLTVSKMSFEATRNRANPLPPSIHTIIFEESSMIGTDLFSQVLDACPHKPQFIFLGDIQQLPPIFSSAILGYKLLTCPVVELTDVYRQALESPIIRLAHRILSGKVIEPAELPEWHFPGELKLHPWKKKLSPDIALATAVKFFTTGISTGMYNPESDIILCPFNEALGTIELNKYLANYLAKSRKSPVFEIIAGFRKHYLSVGDRIMYDKRDAIVKKIVTNPAHNGKRPQHESIHLDYHGYNSAAEQERSAEISHDDFDTFMSSEVGSGSVGDGERVRTCSHNVDIEYLDTDGLIVTLDKASQINLIELGYVLTCHKAQGSEWEKVFILAHSSHAKLATREWWYTACTRARKELFVIMEPDQLINGIKSQRIKGNTLAEKAEFFKGKQDAADAESLLRFGGK